MNHVLYNIVIFALSFFITRNIIRFIPGAVWPSVDEIKNIFKFKSKKEERSPEQIIPPSGPYRTSDKITDEEKLDTSKEKPAKKVAPLKLTTIKWQDVYTGFNCPKCNKSWCYRGTNTPAYCECSLIPDGHFHLGCSGKVDDVEAVGCKAKFVMLSKDHSKDK